MEGPFEEGNVAERFQQADRTGIALEPPTALSQQDEREIGPFLLLPQEGVEGMKIGTAQRFFGDEREAGTRSQLRDQRRQIGRNGRIDPGLAQHGGGDAGIAAERGKDDRPLGGSPIHAGITLAQPPPPAGRSTTEHRATRPGMR